MNKLFTAAVLLAMTTMSATAQQHLIINELMQSNVECFFDDQTKEFPDSWVELYNPTGDAISLGSYKIGTKNKADKAWALPSNITVPADGYIIIYCDKEEDGLHTDFRLDSDKEGGCLYLFEGSTIVSSVVGIPVMPAPDIAYGRDANDNWGYELTSTPGAANAGGVVPTIFWVLPTSTFRVRYLRLRKAALSNFICRSPKVLLRVLSSAIPLTVESLRVNLR